MRYSTPPIPQLLKNATRTILGKKFFLLSLLFKNIYLHYLLPYSVSINVVLELIEPSARGVFIFWALIDRVERGASEEKRI